MAKRACSVLLAVLDYLGVHNAIKHHTRIACATSKVVPHVSALRQPTAQEPVLVVAPVFVFIALGGPIDKGMLMPWLTNNIQV